MSTTPGRPDPARPDRSRPDSSRPDPSRPDPSRFLSGSSGDPGGRARLLALRAADRLLDAHVARAAAGRLDELAAAAPRRSVLVLSVYRGDGGLLPAAIDELSTSRHRVSFALGSMDAPAPALASHTAATGLTGGKFENLNALLPQPDQGSDPIPETREADPLPQTAMGSDPSAVSGRGSEQAKGHPADWVLVVDDDVALPPRFLDRFVGVAEHHELALAQPAQSLASHAAWPVTRRRRGVLLRESRFVEIGPVTLFRRDALDALAPFPPLRYGWGLDLHWGAVARERGWRLGIVDALAVRHEQARVAASYSSQDAIAEAQEFLASRPFIESEEAQEIVRVHGMRSP